MHHIRKIAKLITDDPDIFTEGWTVEGWIEDDNDEWAGYEEAPEEIDLLKKQTLQNELIKRANIAGGDFASGSHQAEEPLSPSAWNELNLRHKKLLADEAQNNAEFLYKLARKYANLDKKDWELLSRTEKSKYYNEVLSYFDEIMSTPE